MAMTLGRTPGVIRGSGVGARVPGARAERLRAEADRDSRGGSPTPSILDHGNREPQRYGLESWFEADEFGALGRRPIQVLRGIRSGPEPPFFVLPFEWRRSSLAHAAMEATTSEILIEFSLLDPARLNRAHLARVGSAVSDR